jgi:hypothetical protein
MKSTQQSIWLVIYDSLARDDDGILLPAHAHSCFPNSVANHVTIINIPFFLLQVWFQNRRSKERRMKQLSALGARRHFFRNPRRMRALRAGMSPHELDDSPEMMGTPGSYYYGGKTHFSISVTQNVTFANFIVSSDRRCRENSLIIYTNET